MQAATGSCRSLTPHPFLPKQPPRGALRHPIWALTAEGRVGIAPRDSEGLVGAEGIFCLLGHHGLGDFHSRKLCLTVLETGSQTKEPARLVSGEGSTLGLQVAILPSFLCAHRLHWVTSGESGASLISILLRTLRALILWDQGPTQQPH